MATAFIIDDHPLARLAIRGVLEAHQIDVTQEFDNGTVAFTALQKSHPDVVIIDVDIPGVNGIELIEKLRKDHYRGIIIVVSAKNDRYYSRRSAEAGAHSFISKKEEMENIISAIEAARKGYGYFPIDLDDFTSVPASDHEKLELLSTQEMKVMSYMLGGHDNNKIGEQMHISAKTVSTYKTRLMEKLDCKTLIELLAFANQNKLI